MSADIVPSSAEGKALQVSRDCEQHPEQKLTVRENHRPQFRSNSCPWAGLLKMTK